MTLTFATRGYVVPINSTPQFPHWGYLYNEVPVEPPVAEKPIRQVMQPASARRVQAVDNRILEDDFELLTIIQAYIKARYS